jgi:hypothetical protein
VNADRLQVAACPAVTGTAAISPNAQVAAMKRPRGDRRVAGRGSVSSKAPITSGLDR